MITAILIYIAFQVIVGVIAGVIDSYN